MVAALALLLAAPAAAEVPIEIAASGHATAPVEGSFGVRQFVFDTGAEGSAVYANFADEVGLKWMVAAGYDPQGMLRLFKALSASGSSSMPAFLSTHPANEERARMVEAFIASRGDSPRKTE